MLYGVISDVKDLSSENDGRFGNVMPEKMLRGDPEGLEVTQGQLVRTFGDRLLLTESDFEDFVKQRNLIVHSYRRQTGANIRGSKKLNCPEIFLLNFIENCDRWIEILLGLSVVFREELAKKTGLSFTPTKADRANKKRYVSTAAVYAAKNNPATSK